MSKAVSVDAGVEPDLLVADDADLDSRNLADGGDGDRLDGSSLSLRPWEARVYHWPA